MKPLAVISLIVLFVTPGLGAAAAEHTAAQPLVQIALLLDNSGSMSGLIDQARAHLWRVVNEFATAQQHGVRPRLQVALYIYGDPPATRLVELTDDLDKVSEQLFAVTIRGGSEYCGQVIQMATRDLAWSGSPSDLKLIFIAGNEPFSQGPVDYRAACRDAIARGIIVNTIHCGAGVPDDWAEGALLADGKAMSINHNQAIAHIETPQDAELVRLNAQLNATYLAYGGGGRDGRARQEAQDAAVAAVAPQAQAQRIAAKSSDHYTNAGWDLVDALKDKLVDLDKIAPAELPEAMRHMTADQRAAYIQEMAQKRAAVREQIQKLNVQRESYLAEARQAQAGERGLDEAILTAVREQAKTRSFIFE